MRSVPMARETRSLSSGSAASRSSGAPRSSRNGKPGACLRAPRRPVPQAPRDLQGPALPVLDRGFARARAQRSGVEDGRPRAARRRAPRPGGGAQLELLQRPEAPAARADRLAQGLMSACRPLAPGARVEASALPPARSAGGLLKDGYACSFGGFGESLIGGGERGPASHRQFRIGGIMDR